MLRFISLGSGSSGNCYLLFTPTDALLIDIGIGLRTLRKNLKDYGIKFDLIHHVLVTHDHADHIKSVGSFSRDTGVPVYATEKVHRGILRNYCVVHKIPEAQVRHINKGETLQIGEFEVTPFGVPHDSSDNCGYRVRAEGVTFCVITDAGHITDEMKTMISEADYLVIEANHDEEMVLNGPYPKFLKDRILSQSGHLSNKDCATALAENMSEHLQHVWLCHLSEENNHPELARKTVEGILRSYGIVVGSDLRLEVLKRTSPTGVFDLSVSAPDKEEGAQQE